MELESSCLLLFEVHLNFYPFAKLTSIYSGGISLAELKAELKPLRKSIASLTLMQGNVWEGISSQGRSKAQNDDFTSTVCDYYGVQTNFCMMCGTGEQVRTAHLWPYSKATNTTLLEALNLCRKDIEFDPKNAMRLSPAIERAFDHQEVCFIHYEGEFRLYVLNKDLLPVPINKTGKTFEQVHNLPVSFGPSGKVPWRRVLAYHAYHAMSHALKMMSVESESHWRCDFSDPLEIYKTVSLLSDIECDMTGFLEDVADLWKH